MKFIYKTKVILSAFLLLHIFLLISTKFTAWPEMSLWPYLMTRGWLPYKDIAIAHTPLLFSTLALYYKLFGTGILQLKIYTWLFILITDLLLFFVAQKLWNKKVAVIATCFYIFLQVFYDGNGLWFDLAFTPFAILVLYFIKTKKYLWAGILWGLAIITKQTAVWFFLPILFSLYTLQGTVFPTKGWSFSGRKGDTLKGVKRLVAGVFLILLILLILLTLFGILDDFLFWAVRFGIFYLPQATGQVDYPTFRQILIYGFPFIPLFLVPELLPWAIAGAMGVIPRFELFHFQPALPFLTMALGIIFSKIKNFKNIMLILYIFLLSILLARNIARNFGTETRFYEQDVQDVVSQISNLKSPISNLYVLNYWDNIYALTDTLPTTKPWFPYLPWYLNVPGVRDEITGDLKSDLPEVVVVAVNPPYNWNEMDQVLKYFSCNNINEKVVICRKN